MVISSTWLKPIHLQCSTPQALFHERRCSSNFLCTSHQLQALEDGAGHTRQHIFCKFVWHADKTVDILKRTCRSSKLLSSSRGGRSSVIKKQRGSPHNALYFICRVMGRRVFVPPPTWLNWNPMRASTKALLPTTFHNRRRKTTKT